MDWLRSLGPVADTSVVVVVDGGGTQSRAAVGTSDGELLAYAEGGPTNQRSAGDDDAAANLRDVIAAAVADAGAPEVGSVLVSSASVDTQAHVDVLSAGVAEALPSAGDVLVMADTIGCWAATASLEPAVALIAGTGSAVLAGSLEHGSRRFGGWDYVLGDEGSGFALGRDALREVLLVSEGRSDATILADACRARLGIEETDELFDRIYKPEIDKSVIASFARDVLDLATKGDPCSTAIVDDQQRRLAETVAAAFRAYPSIHTLGCFGGLWNVELYRTRFIRAVMTALGHRPTIVYPGDTAMAGSFRLLHRLGPDGAAGDAEDAAVARFTEALAAAKDAAG
ncbi:MAG: hypothetical protein KDA97_05750 [Acidimicrobiales bacterium]|nr:hypothetical protein [Acidimicrobiales bacterium]